MVLIDNGRKHSVTAHAEPHVNIVVPGEPCGMGRVSRTVPDIEVMSILPVVPLNPQIAFRINACKRDQPMKWTWFITACIGLVVPCP
jgi:hypothetical protein